MFDLAIVIPYYKPDFISKTLESLRNQKCRNFHLYIADDYSDFPLSDDKFKIIENLKFIYHRFEENMGSKNLVKHWERALDLTKKEKWIWILGDDDVLMESAVEEFYRTLEILTDDVSVFRFPITLIDETDKPFKMIHVQPEYEMPVSSYLRKLLKVNESFLSEYIFHAGVLRNIGFRNYPMAWHADDKLIMDVCGKLPMYTINNSRVYIRMSKSNISMLENNLIEKANASRMFLKDMILEHWSEMKFSDLILVFKAFKMKIGFRPTLYVFLKNFITIIKGKFMLSCA